MTINIKKWGKKKKVVESKSQISEISYVHSGVFLATLNTACRWREQSAKKNMLSISKVVTFEAAPKFWVMKDRRKSFKERTC